MLAEARPAAYEVPAVVLEVAPDIERLLLDGRKDVGRWAANGLGIYLHDKQLQVIEALYSDPATFYVLWWANRSGKTMPVVIWHLHGAFYKYELPPPDMGSDRDYQLWVAEDYRTLHTAPTTGLVSKHWAYAGEIIKGTHAAQRDENGTRRAAPLGAFFTPAVESIAGSGEHPVVRCLSGGTIDFYSTEGNATRIESMPWYRGSWDEWPLQDAADKSEAIRTVFNRLMTRLSDYNGRLILTGTITPETEHIAKEWIHLCEDPSEPDWWGMAASRRDNPYASTKSIALAQRQVDAGAMDQEDFDRIVEGRVGGVKDRVFPGYMVDPVFRNDLARFTPPHPEDGVQFEDVPDLRLARRDRDGKAILPRARLRPKGSSPWTYLHCWDVALAVADNVGFVLRAPADWMFSVERPIEGVARKVIPGSRTLTSAEILHTIEETFLPYGGQIVIDATDGNGKNIARELRRAGYPVIEFVFNERDQRRVIRKEQALINARLLMTEGMQVVRNASGEVKHDAMGVPVFDRDQPYGVVKLPQEWVKTHDQIAVLSVDEERQRKQRKDEAMAFTMGADVAFRERRARMRGPGNQRLAVFAGGRPSGGSPWRRQ